MPFTPAPGVTLRPELAASMEELPALVVQQGLLGLQVLPIAKVGEKTGQLPIRQRDELLRIQNLRRAPGADYVRPGAPDEISAFTYLCQEYGEEEPLDDGEAKFYGRYFDAETASADKALTKVLLAQEQRIAAAIQDTAIFAYTGVAVKWNTPATAVPMTDIATATRAFEEQTGGLPPNALIISRRTQQDLSFAAQIINRLAYTAPEVGKAILSPEMLAGALGIEGKVLVGKAMYNSADPGQTPVYVRLWDPQYAVLARISEGEAIAQPCIGRTALWTEDCPEAVILESYREEKKRSNIYRARQHTDEKIFSVDFGYILTGVYAA